MNSSDWALVDSPNDLIYVDPDDGKIWELQVWIDYDSSTQMLNVTTLDVTQRICPVRNEERPVPMPTADRNNSLSMTIDLSDVLNEYMYVGFTSARSPAFHLTKASVYSAGVYAWSFSTANFTSSARSSSLPCLPRSLLTYLERHKFVITLVPSLVGLLCAAVITGVAHSFYARWDERRRWRFNIDSDLEEGPHKFSYKELALATNNFSVTQALGRGGFGSVYKGFLPGNKQYVAIKRVSPESKQGEREFLAEVMIIGRVRHRNLVRLQGWCHEQGELLLVYDYMPQGSLDKLLFADHAPTAEPDTLEGNMGFPWQRRFKIMQDVASALVYLHYECEQRIIHRDVKAANVMLDAKFNARLGDFGLARSYQHSLLTPESTNVAGTLGYLAPELYHTGKQTEQTDVYSFGVFLLEVACGRKPINSQSEDVAVLVDYVWEQWRMSRLLDTVDPKLAGVYDVDEVTRVLCLGLFCSHPDADVRPSMRHVLLILTGDIVLPIVPISKRTLQR